MVFLVIGGGSIGKRRIRNLKTLGYNDIFCLKRQDDPAFAVEMGVKVVTGLQQVKAHIDAAFICNPTALHDESMRQVLSLDCAVFMEKPLVHSEDSLARIQTYLPTLRRPFFIGFMLRYHSLIKKIKEVLIGNTLGSVFGARFEFGSYLPNWHPWEDHKIGYAARRDLGGGIINTITHELDLIQYFFGRPDSVSCSAMNLQKLGIDVEELAEATFSYRDKLVSLHLDFLQKDYNRSIAILCDNGSIAWNWRDNKVVVKQPGVEPVEYLYPGPFNVDQIYDEEVADFINIVKKDVRTHSLDGAHAVENAELMLAMHRSVREGKRVDISKTKYVNRQ